MNTETKTCQNCNQTFVIEPEDFNFYKKMDVPPPTFCPECRLQRRLMFLNERTLYRRTCNLCGKNIISMFAPEGPYTVYCNPCWWSDKWEASNYAMDYDPDKNFFEQFKILQSKVPVMALLADYPKLVNSDYCNNVGQLKNCYLVYDADIAENMYYSSTVANGRDSLDTLLFIDSENCYEGINLQKCSKTFYSEDCISCQEVYFSKNLSGCSNCVGCINLRSKSYCIFNEQLTKDEYEKKFEKLELNTHSGITKTRERAYEYWKTQPHKFMHGKRNVNVSGDYVTNSKNAQYAYQCDGVEGGKYCQRLTMSPSKDVYDYTIWGKGAQRVYEGIVVGEGVDNAKFNFACWSGNNLNIEYNMFCISCEDVFGSVGLRKKKFHILNKEYGEEEYKDIVSTIKEEMTKNPYVDEKGRKFTYGEFFPYDLSYFSYNESSATQYYDLEKDEVLENGWKWHKKKENVYSITRQAADLPDNIEDVGDDVKEDVIGCLDCSRAYKIVAGEFDLLKRFGAPLPRYCPECRFKKRMERLNPPRFWQRNCAKCGADITTSYSPERDEVIYCDSCYKEDIM